MRFVHKDTLYNLDFIEGPNNTAALILRRLEENKEVMDKGPFNESMEKDYFVYTTIQEHSGTHDEMVKLNLEILDKYDADILSEEEDFNEVVKRLGGTKAYKRFQRMLRDLGFIASTIKQTWTLKDFKEYYLQGLTIVMRDSVKKGNIIPEYTFSVIILKNDLDDEVVRISVEAGVFTSSFRTDYHKIKMGMDFSQPFVDQLNNFNTEQINEIKNT